MRERRCEACGRRVVLVNWDKMRGVVGLTMAWVHVNRFGFLVRRSNHAPVVTE